MKKGVMFGLGAGIAALATAAVLAGKISKEIKDDLIEEEFDSPFGNNWIKISMGSSGLAKGLMYIKVSAECDSNEDVCKLVILAEKDAAISMVWEDNEHFLLLVGGGKRKQCCDVVFDIKNITMKYYPVKI
ncbi:MAG: hypothetical protein IKL18_06715 [Oscillospiraceae bacterium]|nr:hypothetical protein [Oscillospiraceae bacterium]